MHRHYARVVLVVAAVALFASTLATAVAADPVANSSIVDRIDQKPQQLRGVDVSEHLGSRLPLDLPFRDSTGRTVRLRDYFDGKLPVIVTLNYSSCPMLCSMVLGGLAEGMRGVEWSAGREYRVVTVSLDPTESDDLAATTRRRFLERYARPGANGGWQFLRGSDENVHALANAIGFSYNYDLEQKQYYHPAVVALATPDGVLARYLYGIQFHPQTLRLALVESSEGKIGTTIDKLLLFCCAYDSTRGNYALVASKVMTLGGALTVVVMGAFLGSLWLFERRQRRKQTPAEGIS